MKSQLAIAALTVAALTACGSGAEGGAAIEPSTPVEVSPSLQPEPDPESAIPDVDSSSTASDSTIASTAPTTSVAASTAPPATSTTTSATSATTIGVVDRYQFSPNGSALFASPDGRWFLDQQGCVSAVDAGAVPACPDDVSSVKNAAWAPDSSLVAFDEDAFALLGGSDIHVARIENQNTEPGTPPIVQFDNLTADATVEQDDTLNVIPLVLGDQIRFLRLSNPQPKSPFELVTIDLDGNVIETVDTELPMSDLASADAALVDQRHVVLGRRSDTQNQLLTIDADGTVESHSPPDETTVYLFGNSDPAAVITFDFGLDVGSSASTGRVSVFDGTNLDATGLPALGDGPLDPQAVDVSPDGTRILAAYSSNAADSITLRVWDRETSVVTDIGTIQVGGVRALRWASDESVVVFADSEVLEVSIQSF